MVVMHYLYDAAREMLRGGLGYWAWVLTLLVVIAAGLWFYVQQLQHGLVVTGMSDQVSWGFYIANFTFLVGVAASAVMVVLGNLLAEYFGVRVDKKYQRADWSRRPLPTNREPAPNGRSSCWSITRAR